MCGTVTKLDIAIPHIGQRAEAVMLDFKQSIGMAERFTPPTCGIGWIVAGSTDFSIADTAA